MPTEEEKRAAEEAAAAELEAKIASVIDAKLNPAITGHMKRLGAQLEKTLGEQVAKLAPKAAEPPADPASGARPVDPELKLLREKFEALEKQNAESTARAKTVEEKARRDSARATVREQLDAAGIKGARAAALIAHFEASGQLRFDDEGQPVFAVKRARQKGAAAEELTYALDDIGRAMDDWKKTPDAAEFLPPPAPITPAKRPGALPARAPSGAVSGDRAPSEGELLDRFVDDMARRGVSLGGD